MTTRAKGLIVTLDRDIREDDIKTITSAIMMIRNVVAVDNVEADPGDLIIEMRVKSKIRDKLYKLIDEI